MPGSENDVQRRFDGVEDRGRQPDEAQDADPAQHLALALDLPHLLEERFGKIGMKSLNGADDVCLEGGVGAEERPGGNEG